MSVRRVPITGCLVNSHGGDECMPRGSCELLGSEFCPRSSGYTGPAFVETTMPADPEAEMGEDG